MKQYCATCGFKFEANRTGRKAKVCSSCRKVRGDNWRKDQEAAKEKPKKKEPKIEAI